MPLSGRKLTSTSGPPEGGWLSKFLLSPHFTGLLLPAVILAVGAVYHLVAIRQHQQTEKELREELRVLRDDKESLESRLKALEGEVEKLKKQTPRDAKSAGRAPASPALDEML